MATDEPHVDPRELDRRADNDTTPLVALVPDQPYSRGGIISESRTTSPAYQAFLQRARDART